jgi:division protein CdvB (Snf7/Vps24/ESCRT-III family)
MQKSLTKKFIERWNWKENRFNKMIQKNKQNFTKDPRTKKFFKKTRMKFEILIN